jgi:glycosyltransferase involved in cell wall biosynthesis
MTGVSFITTIFNKTPFLRRVVDALRRQTGQFDREFIFVDDGSTDGSAAMIAELTDGPIQSLSCVSPIAGHRRRPMPARRAHRRRG